MSRTYRMNAVKVAAQQMLMGSNTYYYKPHPHCVDTLDKMTRKSNWFPAGWDKEDCKPPYNRMHQKQIVRNELNSLEE